MAAYLLDTHALLWAVRQDTAEVSSTFFRELEQWQRDGIAYLSPITSWEIGLLVAAKRLDLGIPVDQFWDNVTQKDALRVLPLTAPILIQSTRLPGELHRDPCDRILAATAREHDMVLVTRDKLLLNYAKAGHITARKP